MGYINKQQVQAEERWNHFFDQLGFKMEGASFQDMFFSNVIRIALTPLEEPATTERLQAFMEYLHRNGVLMADTQVAVQKIVTRKPSWVGSTDLTIPPITITFHIEDHYWDQNYWDQMQRFAVMDSLHALHFLEHETMWLLSV